MQKVENIKKVNLNANEFQELTIYNDGKLAFISNLKDIDVSSMVQTEIYVIALVLEGKAQVNINGTTYVAYKNDIFICPRAPCQVWIFNVNASECQENIFRSCFRWPTMYGISSYYLRKIRYLLCLLMK